MKQIMNTLELESRLNPAKCEAGNWHIFHSVPFTLWADGRRYVQIGNAHRPNMALMICETDHDRELIQLFIKRWNDAVGEEL